MLDQKYYRNENGDISKRAIHHFRCRFYTKTDWTELTELIFHHSPHASSFPVRNTIMRPVPRRKEDSTRNSFLLFKPKSTNPESSSKLQHLISLADIYEGALRKVLNLQLNLKIEEHPRFHDVSDVTYHDKPSPPRPRAIRIEDTKQRDEYRHHRTRTNQDENDPRVTPQGHNVLRKVGERSPAEGSAFHVPSKRRYDVQNFTPMERDSDLPVDRYSVPRHVGLDFPGEYSQSHYHPHIYSPRMDPVRSPRLGPSYMAPRAVVHETYSRYSSHQREIPPLFPVRSSTSDRDGPTTARSTEHEGSERRCPDVSVVNGLRGSSSLKNMNSRMSITTFEKEEKENLEEAFNKANNSLNIHKSALASSSDHSSSHSDRAQPYVRQTRSSSNPVNGLEDRANEKPKTETEKELRSEKNPLGGEEGEKEEFLSNLGLARIF